MSVDTVANSTSVQPITECTTFSLSMTMTSPGRGTKRKRSYAGSGVPASHARNLSRS